MKTRSITQLDIDRAAHAYETKTYDQISDDFGRALTREDYDTIRSHSLLLHPDALIFGCIYATNAKALEVLHTLLSCSDLVNDHAALLRVHNGLEDGHELFFDHLSDELRIRYGDRHAQVLLGEIVGGKPPALKTKTPQLPKGFSWLSAQLFHAFIR